LLGYLQEAATTHACALHASRDETLEKYNCFWMLVRIWCRLDRPLTWKEPVTVRTSHRGGKGASVYRDFDLFVDGDPVGEAVSTWVLADLDTRRLLRMSNVKEFVGTTGGTYSKTKTLSHIHMPEGMAVEEVRRMHYSDTDVNGHVNNTRYADFVSDAAHLERLGRDRFLSELQLDYTGECLPGEDITLFTGEADGKFYVKGVDQEDKPRFDAVLTFSDFA
jgi:acyl-ACP thioesterase